MLKEVLLKSNDYWFDNVHASLFTLNIFPCEQKGRREGCLRDKTKEKEHNFYAIMLLVLHISLSPSLKEAISGTQSQTESKKINKYTIIHVDINQFY